MPVDLIAVGSTSVGQVAAIAKAPVPSAAPLVASVGPVVTSVGAKNALEDPPIAIVETRLPAKRSALCDNTA